MGASKNAKGIRAAYEAFLDDDIQPMMSLLADDVEWINYEGNAFAGHFHGKEGVMKYLATMDQIDFKGMEIESVIGEDDRVVGIVNPDYTVKKTGKQGGGLTVHVYDFRGDEIIRVREVAAYDGDAW